MKQIEKNGLILFYEIQVKAIKHTYFRVKKGYLLVTTNRFVRETKIRQLIFNKFDALYKATHKTKQSDDRILQLWGKKYQLEVSQGSFHYDIKFDTVHATTTQTTEQLKKQILESELISMMKLIRGEILENISKANLDEVPYKYKFLKSKFGSYHRRNHEITLNTFLATLDPIYLKYVIYHEYAHIKEFNHSAQFYLVIDQMMLNHKNIQKTLKKMEILI